MPTAEIELSIDIFDDGAESGEGTRFATLRASDNGTVGTLFDERIGTMNGQTKRYILKWYIYIYNIVALIMILICTCYISFNSSSLIKVCKDMWIKFLNSK